MAPRVAWIFALSAALFATLAARSEEEPPAPLPFASAAPLPFGLSSEPLAVRKLWTQRMPGRITDLSVARKGSRILVATAPDEGVSSQYLLSSYSRDGLLAWRMPLKSPLKAQAISDDGSLAVFATYDDRVSGVGPRGKVEWVAEGSTCKPIVLTQQKRVLCIHDDDPEPRIAFDVFSFQGKKLLSYPSPNDVMAFRVSDDGRSLALGLTRGQVILFDPAFRSIWQRKVAGEILDVSVSSGREPRVAVLYATSFGSRKKRAKGASQEVAVFDGEGRLRAQGSPASYAEQVEATPSGEAVLAYGNGPEGQSLALLPLPKSFGQRKLALKEKWRKGDASYADYSSSVIAAADRAILGFESVTETTRHSRLLVFGLEDGSVRADIPVITEEGAYLYSQGYAGASPERPLLAVGSDDGYLTALELVEHAQRVAGAPEAPRKPKRAARAALKPRRKR